MKIKTNINIPVCYLSVINIIDFFLVTNGNFSATVFYPPSLNHHESQARTHRSRNILRHSAQWGAGRSLTFLSGFPRLTLLSMDAVYREASSKDSLSSGFHTSWGFPHRRLFQWIPHVVRLPPQIPLPVDSTRLEASLTDDSYSGFHTSWGLPNRPLS